MQTRDRKGNSSRNRDTSWKRTQKRLSGYQFFLRACLVEMKAQYPDCSIVLSAVSKLCAETWQKLHADVKKRFQNEADAINLATIRLTDNKKSKPRIYGPKRPLSAFILFCKENRQKVRKDNPGLSMGQISSVLSFLWSQAEEQTKAKFQGLSKSQRERYREELETARKPRTKKTTQEQKIDPEMVQVEIEAMKQEVDTSKQEIMDFHKGPIDFFDMLNFNAGLTNTKKEVVEFKEDELYDFF